VSNFENIIQDKLLLRIYLFSMKTIEIKIDNNVDNLVESHIDLICTEKIDRLKTIVGQSLVEITLIDKGIYKTLIAKFEWKEENLLNVSDFHFVPESDMLFFRSTNQWGVIDIAQKRLIRHESSLWSPLIERKNGYILIIDDLNAESTQLDGRRIDHVPIDPPTESNEFDDRIEFMSPVYGLQILKIK